VIPVASAFRRNVSDRCDFRLQAERQRQVWRPPSGGTATGAVSRVRPRRGAAAYARKTAPPAVDCRWPCRQLSPAPEHHQLQRSDDARAVDESSPPRAAAPLVRFSSWRWRA